MGGVWYEDKYRDSCNSHDNRVTSKYKHTYKGL